MDFFFDSDWLNRDGPYAFTWDHFLIIGIYLTLGVLLALFLRKKNKKTIKIVLISLWGLYLAIKVLYLSTLYIHVATDPEVSFNIRTMLPLHS